MKWNKIQIPALLNNIYKDTCLSIYLSVFCLSKILAARDSMTNQAEDVCLFLCVRPTENVCFSPT